MRLTYESVLVNLQDCSQALYTATEMMGELRDVKGLVHEAEAVHVDIYELIATVSNIIESHKGLRKIYAHFNM